MTLLHGWNIKRSAADSARSGRRFRASEIDVGIRRPRLAKSEIEIASAPKLPKVKREFKAAIRGNVRLMKCACQICTLHTFGARKKTQILSSLDFHSGIQIAALLSAT